MAETVKTPAEPEAGKCRICGTVWAAATIWDGVGQYFPCPICQQIDYLMAAYPQKTPGQQGPTGQEF